MNSPASMPTPPIIAALRVACHRDSNPASSGRERTAKPGPTAVLVSALESLEWHRLEVIYPGTAESPRAIGFVLTT
ncbi:MAG: hypothetical protein ACKV19_17215 [Verrucomicrobiales bacterium]